MKRFLSIIILLISSLGSYSQNIINYGKRVNFVHYSNEQKLFNPFTRTLFQDSKGRLWIGTNSGLIRYDGSDFRRFTNKDGFGTYDVGSVCEDANGKIWVGTFRGLYYMDHGKFNRIDTSIKIRRSMIWSLFKDTDGTLWAGSFNFVYHIDPNKPEDPLIKTYQLTKDDKNLSVRLIERDKNNKLLIGTEGGLYYLKKDTIIRENRNTQGVYSHVEFSDGREWFSGWNSPIYEYVKDQNTAIHNLGSGVLKMVKVSDTEVWAVTWEQGVFRYDGKNFYRYSINEGLNTNSFWTCIKDKEGNIWLGSWGNGLYKYKNDGFVSINEKNGLLTNGIIGVAEDTTGNVCFVSDATITYYNKETNSFTHLTEYNGRPFNLITNVGVNNANEFIIMTYGVPGYKIANGKLSETKWGSAFQFNQDKNDIYYVASEGGFMKFRNVDTVLDRIYPINRKMITIGLYQDLHENYWMFNQFFGVSRYNGKFAYNFSEKNGFVYEAATCAVEDTKGNFWIGTNGRGIYYCKLVNDTTLKILDSLSTNDGLVTDFINTLHIVNNKLIMGTAYGLATMDLSQYPQNGKPVKLFVRDDGLVNDYCVVSFIDKRSRPWIRTVDGVFIFEMDNYLKNTIENSLSLSNVKLFLNDVDWQDLNIATDENGVPENLELSYNENHITFYFKGICLTAPDRVLYKFQLLGFDKNWSMPTAVDYFTYSNLAPGTYTFMLSSCNNDGIWNEKPLEYVFTITPPFWKTIWFNGILVVVIISFVFYYIKYRERKLQEELSILESKVSERTLELRGALSQVEEKQKEIVDSIRYAQRIQSAYLPPAETFHKVFREAFLLFKPKDIVSGDFYWFYTDLESKDKTVFAAVADCTGHGVPGAIMSVICCNALNEVVVNNKVSDPGLILNEVREIVKVSLKSKRFSGQKDGMDIAFIKVNTVTKELSYSGAYNPCIIMDNGQMHILEADKQPIGAYEIEKDFTTKKFMLGKQSTIYLFSDGYADQFGGEKGKKLMFKNFKEIISNIYTADMSKQKQVLEENYEKWKGELEQVDDICVMGLRF